MDFGELGPSGDLLVFVEERVLRIPEFFLEYKFASHINLASNDNVQKVELAVVDFRVVVDVIVKGSDVFLDLVHQAVVLAFLCLFVSGQVFVKFLQ